MPLRRAIRLIALVIAGETIFFLPFVLPRVFRPTILDVYGITNLELGMAYAVYGIVAMFAYFFGGPLADRFNPRILITLALLATLAGGVVLYSLPGAADLNVLYAFWGITTIALFWAPLIRATREWGGAELQGTAFGLLDGGRGLLAALTGSFLVAVYALILPTDVASATLAERSDAFRQVIFLTTGIVLFATVLVWLVLPKKMPAANVDPQALSLKHVGVVLRMPTVWWQAFIILCAYAGFKAADDFSLYAVDVLGLNEVDAARAGTVSLWMRPLAAVSAGLLADRVGAYTMLLASFVLLLVGSFVLASGWVQPGMAGLYLLTISSASLGIFALRGLYYAIMREAAVPWAYTGAAVGIVSVIGYTPDVFMGPLMGWLIDNSPGASGHQQVFWVVAGFAACGLIAASVFNAKARQC